MRVCPSCQEINGYSDVTCTACGVLLVMTVGDRVLAKHFGGLKPHEKKAA